MTLASAALVFAGACGSGQGPVVMAPSATSSTVTTSPTTTTTASTTTTAAATVADPVAEPVAVEVRYRVERRTSDDATAGFEDLVHTTLADPRGWQQARFRLVPDPTAPYVVVLAEPAEVDALCRPYDTWGKWSCQNGPVVALNADRWRTASPKWTGDLATYRQMLVNHEFGHLLGQSHPPSPQCPAPGQPAPVMAQQSTELDGCLPNPWPLPWELELAARHDKPLAPPPPPHRR